MDPCLAVPPASSSFHVGNTSALPKRERIPQTVLLRAPKACHYRRLYMQACVTKFEATMRRGISGGRDVTDVMVTGDNAQGAPPPPRKYFDVCINPQRVYRSSKCTRTPSAKYPAPVPPGIRIPPSATPLSRLENTFECNVRKLSRTF